MSSVEPLATTEGEWWRHHSSPGHKGGPLAMPGAGVSGCRGPFKDLCLASCPVESMPNSAGQFPVQRSARVAGSRLCYTGRGRRIHVLDGSGGCRQNEPLLSSGARAAGVAVATEGDGYTQACEQSGAIAVQASDGHTQAVSLGPSGGHTWTCTNQSHRVMGILWTTSPGPTWWTYPGYKPGAIGWILPNELSVSRCPGIRLGRMASAKKGA